MHESENQPKLFEGKTPIAKSWWISRIFFFWVNPLMSFTQKHEELTIENYGDIRDKDRVGYQIEKLQRIWNTRADRGASKNTLIFAIF